MSVPSARHPMPKFRCNSCLHVQKMFEPVTAGSSSNRVTAAKQYFTSCYHILCNSCRFRNGQNCALCNRSCQFIGCTTNMPKHYQLFFKPISSAKKQLLDIMKFQRMQNFIAKRRLTAKKLHVQKKRMVLIQKVKEAGERRQQAAEKLHKYKIVHHKICQEKRRRDEEKQRKQQLQQPEKNQPRQQQHQHQLNQHQIQQQQQHHHHQNMRRPNEFHRDRQPAHTSRPHHQHGHSNNHQQRNALNTDLSVTSTNSGTVQTDTSLGFRS
ncbi:putative uncharacterized protein DDB_G0279653 [Sitodiplosis mosellana]|uniref:putative uncharacterized protein DDB_G0279653 n=1 Tax=Sitodiplosis mosellana TaxID=263140 RepID=UPI0024450882|nr:putative uncharacterized protein DDB_G0279653 [Sitodiplosis mosellana]XP_055326048.1 putative uncharacterized protein DDB_G0279653 [Sitodiplosis mosellana]